MTAARAASSSQVSALVAAMQSGALSKAEASRRRIVVVFTFPQLFSSLSELKREKSPPKRRESSSEAPHVVADLVGAMREGRLSKSELMSSLSSLRAREHPDVAKLRDVGKRQERLHLSPPDSSSSVTRELREAEMWAELRSNNREKEAAPRPRSAPRLSRRAATPQRTIKSKPRRAPTAEESECTFRPRIKELPGEYGGSKRRREPAAFLDRVERWRLERERALEKRVADDVESAMGECTFQPRISANSRRAAEISRARDARSADERLYEDEQNRRAAREARLSQDSSLQESRFADEHPFRPTRFSHDFDEIKPRYSAAAREHVRRRSVDSSPPPPPRCADCTFVPRVNGVRDDMDLAKSYLSDGVFDRLTRPRKSSTPRDDASEDASSAKTAATRVSVDKFLARQAAFDAKRARRVDSLRDSSKPAFKPELASGSRTSTDFMERLAVSARRRDRRFSESFRDDDDDDECTFAPTISDAASRKPRRSVDELSAGDALRRETSRRLLKLKADHDERARHSFKPDLVASSRAKPHAESKLRITSAPDTYLDRLRRENEKRLENRRRQQREQDRRELRDATFEPRTTKCPTYIKRIARGMALAKQADHSSSLDQPARPTWR
ncbi:hypothetical protein CTAYLR_003280 [Chrysophaeum taylorii]|uniref:Uncharacterized protein n=1 Tax=Chrysophaeum taylorii TaxID=2483200 RepID=A0AAD7UAZ7_9STRA|nr:hypothetical protein CTAYLR_003280 [Chrysophaeum taylorii]